MIATIAMIIVIAEKNSSAIVEIYGFHMIAAIAIIAEKVNEGRGGLHLAHCSRHSSKFNMAAVNRPFLLEGWSFILMGAFQRKRRRETKNP